MVNWAELDQEMAQMLEIFIKFLTVMVEMHPVGIIILSTKMTEIHSVLGS